MRQDDMEQLPTRLTKRAGFVAGAAAGLAMTVLMVAMRFGFDTVMLPEVMADWLTRLLPPAAFDFFLERLQFNAKRLLFALIMAGQVAVGGGIGVAYAAFAPTREITERQRLAVAAVLALVLWLILAGGFTAVAGEGPFGSSLPNGGFGYSTVLLVATAAFALALTQFHTLALAQRHPGQDPGRREFIRRAAIISVLVVGLGTSLPTILNGLSRLTPSTAFRARGKMPTEVTPNNQFYVVAKSLLTPKVNAERWRLEVSGDVGSPLSLTYAELRSMPFIDEFVTLNCVSNVIGGDLISNALWRGVPLKLVLERARLPATAERLAFHAADGYVDSFVVERAMRDEVIVAYEMNGVPLAPEHGFPARIIVPGLYGMENVKWLTKIEPVEAKFRGYWQVRGWADTAVVKTMSRIDVPNPSARVAHGEALIGGVAFAGDRGLRKVEVSHDAGDTWRAAELREPLSPYTWVLWTVRLPGLSSGKQRVLARATDGNGDVQTAEFHGTLPSGATGYDRVSFRVQGPEPTPTPQGQRT